MERAKKIIEGLKRQKTLVTDQEILNTLREYLQILTLKIIYQSKYGAALSFMGGTSLRLCYSLKRYSEDLDFALDDPKTSYRFSDLMNHLQKTLQLHGFSVDLSLSEEKTVQKSFLRFSGLGGIFGLKSFSANQKLHVKLEVDTKPIPLKAGERESFFVNRFDEIFPILKHTLSTLFAGKILAIFQRPYERGRDYYDLIWYLSQKVELNLGYLNRGLKRKKIRTVHDLFDALRSKIIQVNTKVILTDLDRFLEDLSEKVWIQEYPKVFEQLAKKYLKSF